MALLAADPIERPQMLFGDAESDGGSVSGERTLDDAIVGAWEGLVAHAAAACLLCGATLRLRGMEHGVAAGGRCEHCGTTLA
jgi:hypothetical protein